MKSSSALAVLAAAVLSVGVILGFELFNTGERVELAPASSLSNILSAAEFRDSDDDGLEDWEEELWKTDRQKKDTDGDGTNDGEEVKAGRSPILKGPKDKMPSPSAQKTPSAAGEEAGPKTRTEAFAREFFGRYWELRQSGRVLDEADKANLIESVLNRNLVVPFKKYTESDVKTFTPEGPTEIEAYGNALGAAILKNSPKKMENELVIFARALSKGGERELRKLDPIISAYQKGLSAILKIKVPDEALSEHLRFVNTLSQIHSSLKGLRGMNDDYVAGLSSFALYPDHVKELEKSVGELQDYFSLEGVVFSKGEGGYAITGISL